MIGAAGPPAEAVSRVPGGEVVGGIPGVKEIEGLGNGAANTFWDVVLERLAGGVSPIVMPKASAVPAAQATPPPGGVGMLVDGAAPCET